MTLRDIKPGDSVVVENIGGDGALRQHFLDMGVIPGIEITLIKYAPMGDPAEFRIHDYELTLRLAEAEQIEVSKSAAQTVVEAISESEERRSPRKNRKVRDERGQRKTEHPGLGEEGRFHPKGSGSPLADDVTLTFALVGNQNSGKTTLFNRLTGSNQHVGNFPGVTVDRKDGVIKGHPNTLVTDLPGIYSMSPYTSEELVSRNFVLEEKPKAIINIVDVTNIERNLYLTMQLLEMDIPVVVALNMMDELTENGGAIDINLLESLLGTPVVPISAAKNFGIEELISHAIHIAKYQEKPMRQDFCDEKDDNGAIHRSIHAVVHLIQDHAAEKELPLRFCATKVIEGDENITNALELDQNEIETIEHIVKQMEKESGYDKAAAMAYMRFRFIGKVCRQTVKKPHESKERIRSEKIDRILTGKWTAIPVFFAIMIMVFFLTFNVIGAWLQGICENGVNAVTDYIDQMMTNAEVNSTIHSLVIKGIFAGVGSVISFLPIIVTLFFFLSIMEDSGYIARVAFVMDKMLRKIGLSGRSIVPMLIGFGCTVPAVMSTRTLPSERDRRMTILLTPFMSCTAKLPIYAFFINAFFPGKKMLIISALYLGSILVGILVAFLYRKTVFKGEAVPFVMELPNYRMPSAKNVLQLLWEKAKDFLQKAFSVILIASIAIWLLQSFDLHFTMTADPEDSILAVISGLFVPIFRPLGLGDWRIVTSFVSGFMAKESVVSTLQILFAAGVATALSPQAAVSLLVFSLLYTPCVAAIASIRRELGAKWAAGVVVWQCVVAWIMALLVKLLVGCFM